MTANHSATRSLMKANQTGPIRARVLHPTLLFSVISSFAIRALAQDFDIEWFTVGGGGGTISGGPYELMGTISPPGAGSVSGAGYTLTGGFWGMEIASATPPPLEIVCVNRVVTIAWPCTAAGFTLERTSSLTREAMVWAPVAYPVQTNDTHIEVTLPASAYTEFYRLRHLGP